jgi:hypothetical protein
MEIQTASFDLEQKGTFFLDSEFMGAYDSHLDNLSDLRSSLDTTRL